MILNLQNYRRKNLCIKKPFFFTFQMEDFVFLEDARDEYSFAALKHKIPQVRCFYISSSLSSAIKTFTRAKQHFFSYFFSIYLEGAHYGTHSFSDPVRVQRSQRCYRRNQNAGDYSWLFVYKWWRSRNEHR